MIENKYVIKITRKTPESWNRENEEEVHYYNRGLNDGKRYMVKTNVNSANRFTKQETKKNIEEIKRIYKENTINGTLIKIEVIDSETLKPVIINDSEYTKFTRFEIMEI